MTERRVLQVLGRSAGGIARHVAQIVSALDATDGLRVDVAGPSDLPVEMPKAMHDVLVPDGPVGGHRSAVRKLRSLIRAHHYDVVHAHGLRAGIDASLAARRAGVPSLVTIHNLVRPEIAGSRAPLYRVAEDLAVRLSDRTFAVSKDIADHVRARSKQAAGRVEVLHLGVGDPPVLEASRTEVRAALGLSTEDRLIVTASRLAPQKALHVMIHALAQLPPSTRLIVLGVGPLEDELRSLADRLGLAERVRWLGFRSDIAEHIAAADVFSLSSIWEGVPLAAMEAIQLGVPIVATNVGGMGELVHDGRSGRLVRPGNPRALADALREVLSDDVARKSYAENARADLAIDFSTEEMLARLRRAYFEVERA